MTYLGHRNRPFEWQKLVEFDQFTNSSLAQFGQLTNSSLAEFGHFTYIPRAIGKLTEFGKFL